MHVRRPHLQVEFRYHLRTLATRACQVDLPGCADKTGLQLYFFRLPVFTNMLHETKGHQQNVFQSQPNWADGDQPRCSAVQFCDMTKIAPFLETSVDFLCNLYIWVSVFFLNVTVGKTFDWVQAIKIITLPLVCSILLPPHHCGFKVDIQRDNPSLQPSPIYQYTFRCMIRRL